MKYLLLLIMSITVLTSTAYAVEGKVYFGKYFGTVTIPRAPNDYSSAPKYVAGVELKETFFDRITPYTKIETRMDDYYGEYGSFHPSQVRYDIGIDVDVVRIENKGTVGLRLEHSCTHGIDKWTGKVDQYDLIRLEYRF